VKRITERSRGQRMFICVGNVLGRCHLLGEKYPQGEERNWENMIEKEERGKINGNQKSKI
jgi:hypothetical protein